MQAVGAKSGAAARRIYSEFIVSPTGRLNVLLRRRVIRRRPNIAESVQNPVQLTDSKVTHRAASVSRAGRQKWKNDAV